MQENNHEFLRGQWHELVWVKPEYMLIAMKAIAKGTASLFRPVKEQSIEKPFSTSWEELFDILLKIR